MSLKGKKEKEKKTCQLLALRENLLKQEFNSYESLQCKRNAKLPS